MLKLLALQLWVTSNMAGLFIASGSRCLELILSQTAENLTECEDQKVWMFRKAVCYPRFPCFICISERLYFQMLKSFLSTTIMENMKLLVQCTRKFQSQMSFALWHPCHLTWKLVGIWCLRIWHNDESHCYHPSLSLPWYLFAFAPVMLLLWLWKGVYWIDH